MLTSLRSAKSHRLIIPQIWSCSWQRQGWMMGVREQWWKEQAAAQFKRRIQLLGYGKKKIVVTKNTVCIHPHQPAKLLKIGSVPSWWWMVIYCSLPLERVVCTVVQLWLSLLMLRFTNFMCSLICAWLIVCSCTHHYRFKVGVNT